MKEVKKFLDFIHLRSKKQKKGIKLTYLDIKLDNNFCSFRKKGADNKKVIVATLREFVNIEKLL